MEPSSGPLFHTCQNCADSKVRCVRDGEDVCNRCRRLGKKCINRKARRRFHGFQKDLKIQALESKIEQLTRMRDSSSTSLSPNSAKRSDNDSPPTESAAGDVIDQGLLSMEAAETLLEIFKNKMTPHFPFVVIPPDTSAECLRHEKKFLFLAILASASFMDMPLQRRLGMEVKKAVAARMISDGEVTFELLQGLLVYLAWSHYHTRPNRYTQFMQLAVSIIIELRLDRPALTATWKTPLKFKSQHDDAENELTRPSWGLAEQRAVAGCYYLSSTVAVLVQKQSNFPYTPYVEECCKSLFDNPGSPYDKYILQTVRLQLIVDKIDRLSARHAAELGSAGSGAELYVTSLISELETFRTGLPFTLSEFPLLAMQFHAAELCLYQLSLRGINQPVEPHATPSHPFKEELLGAAIIAADSVVNLYLSLPPGSETAFNNTEWMQIGFCMLVASRVLIAAMPPPTATSPGYNTNAEVARRSVSWPATLEQIKQRLDALCTEKVDLNGDKDVFHNFRNRIARIQEWFDGAVMKNTASFDMQQGNFDLLPAFGNDFALMNNEIFAATTNDPLLYDWVNAINFS